MEIHQLLATKINLEKELTKAVNDALEKFEKETGIRPALSMQLEEVQTYGNQRKYLVRSTITF